MDVSVKKKSRKSAADSNEIISLNNVSKAYSTGAPALKDIDLHVN